MGGGKVVTEDIFAKADLTMVNVWATYCGPCIDEMPDLGKISKEYQDKGFQIVGIVSDTYDAEDATAKEIVEETGADYSHIVLNTDLVNGPLKDVQVVPTTFFVDKNGNQVGQVITGSKASRTGKNHRRSTASDLGRRHYEKNAICRCSGGLWYHIYCCWSYAGERWQLYL